MEKTILELLDEERIFSIEKDEDTGIFSFIEECDHYFRLDLTKKQVETLIEELKQLITNPPLN